MLVKSATPHYFKTMDDEHTSLTAALSAAEPLLQDRVPQPADFKLTSDFSPNGDQPNAIAELISGVEQREQDQVLLGVTLWENLYHCPCY